MRKPSLDLRNGRPKQQDEVKVAVEKNKDTKEFEEVDDT